ncbi:hypothetical protein STIAU_3175 [Stigmatella aurantiaca DW4/3-1]|uniref:Uncharacterized protein n=1 Tax=Stigmatella aurantiaca (strain DW4/3-1) TaxID=378806 RepID=Q08X19_STIAD|nr:hypothetical protein STIAU_3175 [Stigmatella aurantiaca DW4/3-1]
MKTSSLIAPKSFGYSTSSRSAQQSSYHWTKSSSVSGAFIGPDSKGPTPFDNFVRTPRAPKMETFLHTRRGPGLETGEPLGLFHGQGQVGALLSHRIPDGAVQPRIEEQVGAVHGGGLEAARHLVLAARAGLEHLAARADALLHRVVQADVEVQEGVLLEAAPVPPVEPLRRHHVEGPGHHLAPAHRLHHLHGLGHGAEDAGEEVRGELHLAPGVALARGGVEGMGAPGMLRPQLRAFHRAQGDALLGRGVALALELVAALGAEAPQVVLVALVARVLPVELEGEPARHSIPLEEVRLLLGGVEHVDRGAPLLAGALDGGLHDGVARVAHVLARGDEEARRGGGGQRGADEELRVVLHPHALGGLGPGEVVDVLAHAVELEVGGGGRHERVPPPERQVVGRPAGLLLGAAALLHGRQPRVPDERGRIGARQRIPLRGGNVGDGGEHLDADGRVEHGDSSNADTRPVPSPRRARRPRP